MKRIYIVAAEASSDLYASYLIKEIKKIYPNDLEFTGIAGKHCIDTGLFSHEYLNKDFAVCGGLYEIFDKFFNIYSALKQIKKRAKLKAYDLFILLDYPEFNINLAKYLNKINVPVIYYITPQVWAWRKYRINYLNKYARELICIFDFEKDLFDANNIKVNYFGHPLIEIINSYKLNLNKEILLKEFNISKTDIVIALLPGSRTSEIKNLLPQMLKATLLIKNEFLNVKFILPVANTLNLDFIKTYTKDYDIQIVENRFYDVLSVSTYAVIASGTASLEALLFKLPMTVLYKVSNLSYFMFKYLIRYKKPIALSNLILNRAKHNLAFQEFFQDTVNSENIAKDVINNLKNLNKYELIFNNLENKLESNKVSQLVAKLVLKYL